jgi:hypothetical protein
MIRLLLAVAKSLIRNDAAMPRPRGDQLRVRLPAQSQSHR